MKLVSVSLRDFRSIQVASKLPFSEFSVLLGPNNEGKSNILAGVVLALGLLAQGHYVYRRQFLRYRYQDDLESFNWERDYPVTRRKSKPNGTSQVTLEFELDAAERKRFRSRTSINLKANLRVKVDFGPQEAKVDLLLSGPIKQGLDQKKINAIAKFVADSIFLQYVPAVRTADMAQEIVERLLAARMRELERDTRYRSLVEELQRLQQPVLQALSKELTETVGSFLPDVTSISVTSDRSLARAISKATSVDVDDGTKTSLRLKGDGIKSLAAIALMRHMGRATLGNRSLILAIEEPESHLHPKAIHRLREVLKGIASDSQVILTTHCAALVDRMVPERNIIVESGSAAPAASIQQIREVLGVLQADNLSSARLILLVEGVNDLPLVARWLQDVSPVVRSAIENGAIALDSLDGVSHLSYKARTHKTNLSDVYAFVDNDVAGREAIRRAEEGGVVLASEYTAAVCPGIPNSELQDLIDDAVWLERVNTHLSIDLTAADVTKVKGDWASRIKHAVEMKGKIWSQTLEATLKKIASEAATQKGAASLSSKRRSSFDALVLALEARVASWT